MELQYPSTDIIKYQMEEFVSSGEDVSRIEYSVLVHAYSIDQDVVYDGYNQEFLPICYAWTVPTATGEQLIIRKPTIKKFDFQ